MSANPRSQLPAVYSAQLTALQCIAERPCTLTLVGAGQRAEAVGLGHGIAVPNLVVVGGVGLQILQDDRVQHRGAVVEGVGHVEQALVGGVDLVVHLCMCGGTGEDRCSSTGEDTTPSRPWRCIPSHSLGGNSRLGARVESCRNVVAGHTSDLRPAAKYMHTSSCASLTAGITRGSCLFCWLYVNTSTQGSRQHLSGAIDDHVEVALRGTIVHIAGSERILFELACAHLRQPWLTVSMGSQMLSGRTACFRNSHQICESLTEMPLLHLIANQQHTPSMSTTALALLLTADAAQCLCIHTNADAA